VIINAVGFWKLNPHTWLGYFVPLAPRPTVSLVVICKRILVNL
jgi:hypothetical protein